jgi:hypothetical protein
VSNEDDDSDLLQLYRAQAKAMPPPALGARILVASRTSHARWWLLATAAAAACLLLAFQMQPHQSQTPPRPVARYVPGGLYDGQAAQQLADPQLMRQQAIMQMPGGSEGRRSNGS